MRKVFLFILSIFLAGCTVSNEDAVEEVIEDTLSVKYERIYVEIDEEIDYLDYITSSNDDEIEYNSIDTSNVGTYTVTYTLNELEASMIVDVVTMYDKIYSPLGITPETIEDPDDITVLVNKQYAIPEDYVPDDLVTVVDSSQQLRKEAAEAYEAFYNAAVAKGISIYSISGYRTNETQTLYWNNQVKVRGEEYASQYSAYPLRSEHQLGLAIDISYMTESDRLSESVADSEIGQFIVSDAYKYGFILRYPEDKTNITNYGYEPWHIRYVGVELATKLYEEDLTLEEYYEVYYK